MNETEIGYTKSADRGKPIQERLNPSDPLSERSSGKGKERVQRVMDLRDDNREHDSLRSLMCRRTMPELTIDLLAHGIPDASLKGKKKADLVELAMDELMPHTLEDFVVLFLPVGGWYVRYLQGLVAAGGRGIVTKRDVRAGVNSPLSLFPVTLLSDQPYEFVIRVPQEALDLLAPLTDEVWDEYARIADRCADFGKYLACAADLCGLVPIQEVADAWAKEKGIQMEGLLQRVIRDAREWADMQSLHVIDVDSLSYAVCSVFFDEYKPRDGSLGMEHVHHLIGEHQKVSRRPVQKRHLEAKDVYAYVLETPEAKELIDLLDQHVPETVGDVDVFSVETVYDLMFALRDGNDDAALCIDAILLEYEHVRVTGALAARIYEAGERLNRIVPKWHLNGWSQAELAQREGRELPRIDAAETACEEPSGYVYVEEDEDDDVYYFGGYAELWEIMSDNEESYSLAYDLFEKDESYETYFGGEVIDEDVWKVFDEENKGYLEEFGTWMEDAGLKKGAISVHTDTVDHFLTTFVSHYIQVPMRFGAYLVRAYLGSYYIRKVFGVIPADIKSVAKSLTKFYECMLDVGHIEQGDYDYLVKDIEDHLDEWCDLCDKYVHS